MKKSEMNDVRRSRDIADLEIRRRELLRQLDISEQRLKDFRVNQGEPRASSLTQPAASATASSELSSISSVQPSVADRPPAKQHHGLSSVLQESSSFYTMLASDSNFTSSQLRTTSYRILSADQSNQQQSASAPREESTTTASDLRLASLESDVFKYLHREVDSPLKQFDLDEDDEDAPHRANEAASPVSPLMKNVSSAVGSSASAAAMKVMVSDDSDRSSTRSVDSADITVPRILDLNRRKILSSLSSSSSSTSNSSGHSSKGSEDWQLVTASASSIRGTVNPSRFDIRSIASASEGSPSRSSLDRLRASAMISSVDSQADDVIQQIEAMSLSWRQRQQQQDVVSAAISPSVSSSIDKPAAVDDSVLSTSLLKESTSMSEISTAVNVRGSDRSPAPSSYSLSMSSTPAAAPSASSSSSSISSPAPTLVLQSLTKIPNPFRYEEVDHSSSSSSSHGSGPTSPLLYQSSFSDRSYRVQLPDDSAVSSNSDLSRSNDSSMSSDVAAVALARKIIYGSPLVESAAVHDVGVGAVESDGDDNDDESEASSQSAEELVRRAQGSSSQTRDLIQREIATMRARLLRLVKSTSSGSDSSSPSNDTSVVADLSQSDLSDASGTGTGTAMTASAGTSAWENSSHSSGSHSDKLASPASDDSIERKVAKESSPRRGIADLGISSFHKPNLAQAKLPPSYPMSVDDESVAVDPLQLQQQPENSSLSMHELLGLNSPDRRDEGEDSFLSSYLPGAASKQAAESVSYADISDLLSSRSSSDHGHEILDVTNDSEDFDIADLLLDSSKLDATTMAAMATETQSTSAPERLALQDSILSAATTSHGSVSLDLTTISLVSASELTSTPAASPVKPK
jgi:trimeric autotransporter adhesin